MYSVPDNLDMLRKYEAEQAKEEERLPRCSMCDEPIYEEQCWRFGDEIICDECAWWNFRVNTADLIE